MGCILAELLGGRPFFKGRDYVDQLTQILKLLGTPSEQTLSRISSPRAQDYVRNLGYMQKVPFKTIFPGANPDALDLLDRMLAFDPLERITVEEALEHPYLAIWHDASDEPECPRTFDFSDFESVEDVGQMRQMILDEVRNFRRLVRGQPPLHDGAGNANYGQQTNGIGIPQQVPPAPSDAPRPHEPHHIHQDLEHELAAGLDAMQQ